MSDQRLELMAAIHARLVGDGTLLDLLGGPRVHDRIPRGAAFPFVAFGETDGRPSDGDPSPVTEHRLTLEVLSRAYGRSEAAGIADRLTELLHDAPLDLAAGRLVHIRHVSTRIRAERDRRSFRAVVRLRAVTEPAA